jgi:hypothetical protein
MKTKLFNFTYDKLFRVYLYLIKFGYSNSIKNRVYDNYGIIDTLGNESDNTRFTWSYTEEMGCVWAIKLPFKYSLMLVDYFEKEIRLERTPHYFNSFQY